MKKTILSIGIIFTLISCNLNLRDNLSQEKAWVYVELEAITSSDTSSYYYYGQISQQLLDKIDEKNQNKGLFMLSNIRYLDDFNEMKAYEDEYDQGSLFFRIQDIVKIQVLKEDPLYHNSLATEADSTNI